MNLTEHSKLQTIEPTLFTSGLSSDPVHVARPFLRRDRCYRCVGRLRSAAAEREVKEKLQQSTWLAESVFEATQISIRDELRKTKEKVQQQREALDAMEKKIAELNIVLHESFAGS